MSREYHGPCPECGGHVASPIGAADDCLACGGTGWDHGMREEKPAGGAGAERLTPPPLGRQLQCCQADVERGPCRYCKRPWREWAYLDTTAWRLNECPAQMQAQANALHAALRALRAALAGITPDTVESLRRLRDWLTARPITDYGASLASDLRDGTDALARALATAQPTLNELSTPSIVDSSADAAADRGGRREDA